MSVRVRVRVRVRCILGSALASTVSKQGQPGFARVKIS